MSDNTSQASDNTSQAGDNTSESSGNTSQAGDNMSELSNTSPGEVCPACGARAETAGDLELGEILWCEHCGAELEVVSTDPLRIDLFEEEEK